MLGGGALVFGLRVLPRGMTIEGRSGLIWGVVRAASALAAWARAVWRAAVSVCVGVVKGDGFAASGEIEESFATTPTGKERLSGTPAALRMTALVVGWSSSKGNEVVGAEVVGVDAVSPGIDAEVG